MIDRDQYWHDRSRLYAYALYQLIDGDCDPEAIFKMMTEDSFVDTNQEWIYDD